MLRFLLSYPKLSLHLTVDVVSRNCEQEALFGAVRKLEIAPLARGNVNTKLFIITALIHV